MPRLLADCSRTPHSVFIRPLHPDDGSRGLGPIFMGLTKGDFRHNLLGSHVDEGDTGRSCE